MFASESGLITTGPATAVGTYTVAAGGVAVPVSVVPAAGTGPAQRFSFTISDQGGAGFLTGLAALFSTSASINVNECALAYDRTAGTVSLGFDNPANGATAVVPGSSTFASNSQCTLNAANTTVVIGVTSIVITMDLTFHANFFGAKNVYLAAVEPGFNSGYVDLGTWTVTGGAPSAISVSPATGSGLSPSFTFTVSDSSSAANISAMNMLITTGAPTNTANACSLVYNVLNATIGLYANNGTTLSTKGIGSSATLQNSQCAVGYTVASTSGNSVIFTINLVFAGAFAGSQTVYLDALEPERKLGLGRGRHMDGAVSEHFRWLVGIGRKLRLIAASDLVKRDQIRYALRAAGWGTEPVTYRLRGGVSVALRKGATDGKVFDEIFVERVYAPCLAALPENLGSVTLIDLGAYTGLSALFFAHELAVDEIVAVEPDPDNFRLLLENLRTTRLASRSTALKAFAGAQHAFAEVEDSGNGAWGMRMGPLSDTGTPVLPLAEIAQAAKSNAPVVLKCDIEGGERQIFFHIRDWEHLIRYILIELHTEFLSVREMLACLESSRFHWTIHGTPPEGASIAFFLLQRGEQRAVPLAARAAGL